MTYHDALTRIIDEFAAPEATHTDRSGAFPRKTIDALGEAGLLGLTVPTAYGGGGAGLSAATDVVRQLAAACGSTAMIVMMHYSAVAALVATGREDVLRDIAAGRHLSTLAFSEAGSRSHFWAPLSTASADDGHVRLDARKSWVTSAHEADSYVWSSRPLAAPGPMTLWLVPAGSAGLSVTAHFDGLGLRGNDSCPVGATDVRVPRDAMLGADGKGLDIALSAVLPWFLLLNASASVGIMQAVTAETVQHIGSARLEHLGQALSGQVTARAAVARMRIDVDRGRALLQDTLTAVETGRPDAQLLVLEIKAAVGDSAVAVADLAMKTCGGAAFRKELGIERRFRDALASRVMAPTSDALHDFVGRTLCGLPLFDGSAA